MEANTNKVADLIIKYRKSTLSAKEKEELDAWRNLSEHNEILFKSLTDDSYTTNLKLDLRGDWKKIKQLYKENTGRSLPMPRTTFLSIAASVVVLLTAGVIWFLIPSSVNKPVLSKTEPKRLPNIIPAVNKATQPVKQVTLTLSNNSTILLDTMATGSSFHYNNSQVVKVNKEKLQIVPVTANIPSMKIEEALNNIFNTLQIPNGRTFELELADGSTVVLNAASTFSFPMEFTSNERRVELTGEAYFEVKPVLLEGTKKVPFIVNALGTTINVMGTQINVTAYYGEPVTTTLIAGEMDILNEDSTTTQLQPGKQATFSNGQVTELIDVDLEMATALKRNLFVFRATPLASILRQISHWYGVNFDLECCQSTLYNLTASREEKLPAFLKTMEQMGDVQFKKDGNNILVMSK